MLFNIT